MVHKSRLFLVLAALCFLPAIAHADRTIITPSGYTQPEGYNFEGLHTISGQSRTVAYLDESLSNIQYGAAFIDRPNVSRLSLSVQALILPESFVTPEVSAGITDIANTTGRFASDGFYGRGYYLAFSKSLDTSLNPPKIHGVVLTAGLGGGSYHGLFGGVTTDLPLRLLGTAEYDSRRTNYRIALPITTVANFSYNRIGAANWLSLDFHSPVSL